MGNLTPQKTSRFEMERDRPGQGYEFTKPPHRCCPNAFASERASAVSDPSLDPNVLIRLGTSRGAGIRWRRLSN